MRRSAQTLATPSSVRRLNTSRVAHFWRRSAPARLHLNAPIAAAELCAMEMQWIFNLRNWRQRRINKFPATGSTTMHSAPGFIYIIQIVGPAANTQPADAPQGLHPTPKDIERVIPAVLLWFRNKLPLCRTVAPSSDCHCAVSYRVICSPGVLDRRVGVNSGLPIPSYPPQPRWMSGVAVVYECWILGSMALHFCDSVLREEMSRAFCHARNRHHWTCALRQQLSRQKIKRLVVIAKFSGFRSLLSTSD